MSLKALLTPNFQVIFLDQYSVSITLIPVWEHEGKKNECKPAACIHTYLVYADFSDKILSKNMGSQFISGLYFPHLFSYSDGFVQC